MTTQTYPEVGESMTTETLDNGLKVLIVPQPHYHETYALMTTDYGSLDTQYTPYGQLAAVHDPEGIAHFLEHKLFEKKDHDAFDLFGQTGASANAFTSAIRTSFLFSTTQAPIKNLMTLLDFVQDPYFSDKTVEKEKGIIGQEIQMYQDDPGSRLYFGIIGNLYPNHPLSKDVTGTLDSIAKITPAMLYQAYHTFYQPANMTLVVAGAVKADEVLDAVKANQAKKTFEKPQPIRRETAFDGSAETITPFKELNLPVVRPKSLVGIKGLTPVLDDVAGTRRQMSARILLEMLFGDSSSWFQTHYEDGTLDDSFDFDYNAQRGYNYATIGGDATDPKKLSDAIIKVLENPNLELDPRRFERLKKAALGKFYQSLNALDRLANQVASQSFSEVGLFDYPGLLKTLTLADLEAARSALFNPEAVSVFHILPEVAK